MKKIFGKNGILLSPFMMVKQFFLVLIKGYQKLISPIIHSQPSRGCRFHPSCSEYAKECIEKLPLYKSIPKTIWRLLRCNPFHKGGHDPVIPRDRTEVDFKP